MATNYEVFKTDIDVGLKNAKETLDNLKKLQNDLKGMGKFSTDLSKNFGNLRDTLKQFSTRSTDLFGKNFTTYINKTNSEFDKLNATINSLFKNLTKKSEPSVLLLKKRFQELSAEAKKSDNILGSLQKYDVQIGQIQKGLTAPGLPQGGVDQLNKQLSEAQTKRQVILDLLSKEGRTVADVEQLYQQQLKDLQEVAKQVKTVSEEQVKAANAQRETNQALKEAVKEQEKLVKLKEQEIASQAKIALEEKRFEQIEARRAALRSKGISGVTPEVLKSSLAGIKAAGDIPIKGVGDIFKVINQVGEATKEVRRSFSDVTAAVNLFGAQGGNAFVAIRRAIYGTSEPTGKLGELLNFAVKQTTSFNKATTELQAEAARLAQSIAASNTELRSMGSSLRRIGHEEDVAESEFAQLNTQITKSVNEFEKLQSAIQRGATGPKFGQDIRAYITGVENLNRQFDNLEETLTTVYKLDPVSSKTLQRLQQMRGAVGENERALQEISANLKAVDQGGNVFDKLKRGVQNLVPPFLRTKKEVAETADGAFRLSGSFDEAAQKGNIVKQSIDGMAKSASFFGDVLKSAIGTAIGIPLSGIVTQLMDFITAPLKIPINAVLLPFRMMSDIIGTITNQFASFFANLPAQFLQSNKLVQDFNTTIKQMLSGFDEKKITNALRGINEFVREIIAKTPFELATGQQAFQQLATAGFDPREWLLPAADAASAMNKEMGWLINALQRLKAGSKGMAVDMLRDFGIPVQQVGVWMDESTGKMVEANKTLGKSQDELKAAGYAWKQWKFDAAGSLTQTPTEALDILNGYLQQNAIFAGASAARAKTLAGVLSNLNDSITTLLTGFGQPIFQKITDILSDVYGILNEIVTTVEPFAILIGQELAGSIQTLWTSITGIAGGVDEMGNRVEGATSQIKNIASAITEFIKPALFTIMAIVRGEWPKAWGIFLKSAQDAVKRVGEWLNSSAGKGWFQWGVNLIKQIANGIASAARTFIRGAVSVVGRMISSFLKPGSPPEQGPLSDIDKWGAGLAEIFASGFKMADMDFLSNITGSIKEALGDLGLDQFKAIRQNVIDIIGGINKTGQINEELWSKVKNQLGVNNKELAEFIRLQFELKKTSKEYMDAEKAGFIPKELQEKMEAAQLAVQLKEEEIKLQQQLNQASSTGGTGTENAPDPKKQLKDELEMLQKKKKIGLISERDYLDAVAGLRKQYAEQFLVAGDEKAAKDQVNQAKEADKKIFDQDKEFLEKKKKLGLITEAEYLSQLAEMNKAEAERLLLAGDESAARARAAQAKDLEKKVKEAENAEALKQLKEQIEKERQILKIKYDKGLITEKEYRQGLAQILENYVDQALQVGLPVDKEIEQLKALKKSLEDVKPETVLDQPQDILASFGDDVTGELDKMMGDLQTEFGKLGTSTWDEFSKTFTDVLNQSKGEIYRAVFGAVDPRRQQGEVDIFGNLLSSMAGSFRKWAEENKAQINAIGVVIGEALVFGVKVALGIAGGENAIANQIVTSVTSSTASIVSTFGELAGAAMSGFVQGMYEALTGEELGLTGKAMADGIGKGLSDTLMPLSSTTVQNVISFFRDGIFNTDWLFFVSPIADAFRWLYNFLVGESIVPDTVNSIVSWIGSLPGKILQLNLTGQIGGMFTTLTTNIRISFSNLLTWFTTSFAPDLLEWFGSTTSDISDYVTDAIDSLKKYSPFGDDSPSYQSGTPYVPKTGLAKLHEGEMVLPKNLANLVRSNTNIKQTANNGKSYLFEAGAFANAFPNVKTGKDAQDIMSQLEKMIGRSEMRATTV